jgi:voltage-gated potassium channel
MLLNPKLKSLKFKIHTVIFEADTPAGKYFDVSLIFIILFSVLVIMLDSVSSIRKDWSYELRFLEWTFTLIFTIEYALRIFCLRKPRHYILSFYGLVDLMSILPTLMSAFIPGIQYLSSLRVMRVMRIFRIMKLIQYVGEVEYLLKAIYASFKKIIVFLLSILIYVTIFGSIMYLVEGEENGFTSIPKSIYWAIVTLTTVGYGDIAPQTHFGQFLAALVMIGGYAIIAVPTGIVTVEMSKAFRQFHLTKSCLSCGREGHDDDAIHCKYCGVSLE